MVTGFVCSGEVFVQFKRRVVIAVSSAKCVSGVTHGNEVRCESVTQDDPVEQVQNVCVYDVPQ